MRRMGKVIGCGNGCATSQSQQSRRVGLTRLQSRPARPRRLVASGRTARSRGRDTRSSIPRPAIIQQLLTSLVLVPFKTNYMFKETNRCQTEPGAASAHCRTIGNPVRLAAAVGRRVSMDTGTARASQKGR